MHINDGRAFLEQTHTKYDLILFALPDSLTLVAGQSSLRLESYLFTVQAVQAAQAHLKPAAAVRHVQLLPRRPGSVDRLANTLDVAFGHTPCVDDEGFSLSMISDTINPSAPALRHGLAPPGRRRPAGHRRPSVRVPAGQLDPVALPGSRSA